VRPRHNLALALPLSLFASPLAPALPVQGRGTEARPVPKGEKLDAAKRKAIEAIAKEWFAARPATTFDEWDAAKLTALKTKAKALDPLPAAWVADIKSILWTAARAQGPKLDGKPIETRVGKITYDLSEAPDPKRGSQFGLFVGLHGGDNNDKEGSKGVAKSQFAAELGKHKCMGLFPQALGDFGDAWNSAINERSVLTLLEMAKRTFDIDPDRIFVGGFSNGGSGSYFLPGRHPHLFAAAMPFNGIVFPERDGDVIKRLHHGLLPNLRYVPIFSSTGDDDRHCNPDTFVRADADLKQLRGDKTDEYESYFTLRKGDGHVMPKGEPQASYGKVLSRKRKAIPKALTWECTVAPQPTSGDRLLARDFYWLRCEAPAEKMRVEAEALEHSIQIKIERHDPAGFTIYLTEGMVDVTEDVRLYVNNEQKWKGRLEASLVTMLETLSRNLDRQQIFEYRIEL